MSSALDIGRGFVFYPRNYRLDDDAPDKSRVEGVDAKGRRCQLSIRIKESSRTQAARTNRSLPDLRKFADSGRHNNFACVAHEGNGPDAPKGVLLAEQCKVEDAAARHYSAGWMTVLRADESEPAPAIGLGYLHMRLPRPPKDSEYNGLLEEYRRTPNDGGQNFIALDRQAIEIFRVAKPRFSAVLMDYPAMFPFDSKEAMTAAHAQIMDRSVDGKRGGVLLRVRSDDGRASELQSRWVEMGWNPDEKRPHTEGEMRVRIKEAAHKLRDVIRHDRLSVDVIPFTRINATAKGAGPKLLKAVTGPKISRHERLWLPEQHQRNPLLTPSDMPHLVTPIAVRLNGRARGGDGTNSHVLVNVCAFGPALGEVLALDAKGEPVYEVQRSKWAARGVERAAEVARQGASPSLGQPDQASSLEDDGAPDPFGR